MTDERTVVVIPASGSCAQAASETDPAGTAGTGHRAHRHRLALGVRTWPEPVLVVMITPTVLGMGQVRFLLHERRSRARCR